MDLEKERRYQQLLHARLKYSNLTRKNGEKFRTQKQKEVENETARKQREEREQVEAELYRLRLEYDQICRERGQAHKVAALIEAQEHEVKEFEKRRDEVVQRRAKKVAREELKKRINDEKAISDDKAFKLLKRKELLHRDWNEKENHERFRSDAMRDKELELAMLSRLEEKLKERIAIKKTSRQQLKPTPGQPLNSVLNHSEASVEKAAEKAFWPQKPQANWNFLVDDQSSMFTDPQFTHPVPGNHHQHSTPLNQQQQFRPSTFQNPFTRMPSEDPEFPQRIAEKVLARLDQLRSDRDIRHANARKPDLEVADEKIYREMAVNTSRRYPSRASSIVESIQHSRTVQDRDVFSRASSSEGTQYLQLPTGLMKPDRLKATIENLKRQINVGEPRLDTSSLSSSSSSGDDLLAKIEAVKNQILNHAERLDTQTIPKQLYPDVNPVRERTLPAIDEDGDQAAAGQLVNQSEETSSPSSISSQSNHRTIKSVSSLSSSSSSNGSRSKVEKKIFWREVFVGANCTFTDSVEAILDQTRNVPRQSLNRQQLSATISTPSAGSSRSSGFRHSTPKIAGQSDEQGRGIVDEPNLTLIQSFSTELEDDN